MVTRRTVLMAALLLCLLPVWRTALNAAPQDSDFTMEGKITDKSPGKLTINSGDNIIFHILYSDSTEVKKADGTPGTAADLHIGTRISVAGNLAESGEITAKKIEIEGDGAEK
jgi:hypothetical protein